MHLCILAILLLCCHFSKCLCVNSPISPCIYCPCNLLPINTYVHALMNLCANVTINPSFHMAISSGYHISFHPHPYSTMCTCTHTNLYLCIHAYEHISISPLTHILMHPYAYCAAFLCTHISLLLCCHVLTYLHPFFPTAIYQFSYISIQPHPMQPSTHFVT